MAATPPATQPQPVTKELRLALVCYGGSSLAIYMHGTTKEVHRLVKASALLEAGLPSTAPSERVYTDLLAELVARDGIQTRVVVDIVAGTSAGGINGIYLAKALARNLSQDGLRDLWFTRGDMDELTIGPRISWKLKIPLLLFRGLRRSPLRGGAMAKWLHDALTAMDDGGPEPASLGSLMPRDHLLELFVTITDFYGYDRQVPIARPVLVHDSRNRHALRFRYLAGGPDDYGDNGGLAFAARTTSCFPGVFPPVSFGHFHSWVPDAKLDDFRRRCFRLYDLAAADPEKTYFVDGGVLDNKPFGWAITAIGERRADSEVARRLLYLEPDPGEVARERPRPDPTTLAAALGALSGIPRHEPILDDLLDVVAHNERVQRIRDIIETSFDDVARLVRDVVGHDLTQLPPSADDALWKQWNVAVNERARQDAGFGFATYIRLKLSGVVDRYAQTACEICDFPPDSNHALLVRAAIRCWAEDEELFEKCRPDEPDDTGAADKPCELPTQKQLAFLQTFDLAYGVRRLRFVVAALSWWYRDVGKAGFPDRDDLDRGKTILYDAIERLEGLSDGRAFDQALCARIRAVFPDEGLRRFLDEKGLRPQEWVEENKAVLAELKAALEAFLGEQLSGFTADLYSKLAALAAGWDPARRRDLAVRFLGFPFWDVLLFPVQALADVGERDFVTVVRMSPFEARVLRKPAAQKVQGAKLHHFWAFFDREARENDYLWGRLDGAEHLIRILVGDDETSVDRWCRQAFAAILEEDERALPHAQASVREVRALLGQ
jgi:patatin-related protein